MIAFPAKFFTQIATRRKDFARVTLPIILDTLGQPDYALAMLAAQAGAISRLLGRKDEARDLFSHAARLYWPYDRRIWPGLAEDHPLAGALFCQGGICAALAGQTERAMQLFEWCLAEFDQIAPDNLTAWGAREPHGYAKVMLFRAYAEMRTGQWTPVAGHAAEAASSFERAAEREAAVLPDQAALSQVLLTAAAWQQQPALDKADTAQRALAQVVAEAETYLAKADACCYVWDLQAAIPDLFGAVQVQEN